ncbi:MAG: phosphoglucosamine mutase [Bacteroidota bacterium]|nr:phosphoglucosamine mutase [Bacteroidota bacterium]
MSLIVSISGVRGVVGETLTPEVAVLYAKSFAEYCLQKTPQGTKCKIVLGRDGRITGKILTNIISSTLLAMGCDVVAIGVCPTPTVALAVEKSDAIGGIAVTASHNPMQWNGMKFFNHEGLFLDAKEMKDFLEVVNSGYMNYAAWNKIGTHISDTFWIQKHIDTVLQLKCIDVEKIKSRKFKVVLDCINSAGGVIVPPLLKMLECEVVEMNCDVSGIFAHTPEPIPENLTALAQKVRDENADLGIAVDPDVDRLVLITEKGEPLGEEYTIASVVNFVLSREQRAKSPADGGINSEQSVVVNLSTTRAVDEIAKSYNAEVVRTPVGEINVAKKMKEVGAIIGGEGSGGVIYPEAHYGRDAIVGIGLVLQMLAEFGRSLSEYKATLPQYYITKSKVEIGNLNPDKLLNQIIEKFKDEKINTEDGVKIDFADSWVHLRKSNTEPIVRIIAEATNVMEAEQSVKHFKEEILKLSKEH